MSLARGKDCAVRVTEILYIQAWNMLAELKYDEVSASIFIYIHIQMSQYLHPPRPTFSANICFLKIA
jgi:hypothetical protein